MSNFFKNKKLLFCYILFLLSILFAIFLLIFRPQKLEEYYPYEYSNENVVQVEFPIEQHFHNPHNVLRAIHLYARSQSINDYNYLISVTGEKTGKEYFSHLYEGYDSNIMILDIFDYPQEEQDFILKIECDDCKDVVLSKKKSNNSSENYIKGSNDNSVLEFYMLNFVPNYDYYWYSIVGIVLSLLFYPLAKERDCHEKK